jgi:hypothetical protein
MTETTQVFTPTPKTFPNTTTTAMGMQDILTRMTGAVDTKRLGMLHSSVDQ